MKRERGKVEYMIQEADEKSDNFEQLAKMSFS